MSVFLRGKSVPFHPRKCSARVVPVCRKRLPTAPVPIQERFQTGTPSHKSAKVWAIVAVPLLIRGVVALLRPHFTKRPNCAAAVSVFLSGDPLAFRFTKAVFHPPAESVVGASLGQLLTSNLITQLQQHRHTCLASQSYVWCQQNTKSCPGKCWNTPGA